MRFAILTNMDEPICITRQSSDKIRFARALRKRMTEAEIILWEALRNRKIGCKYRRQVAIGSHIVDFCCMHHRLIIEVDGNIHAGLSEHDSLRDQSFVSKGFRTLRILNEEIFHSLPSVLQRIQTACCKGELPHP